MLMISLKSKKPSPMIELDIQVACEAKVPKNRELNAWVTAALQNKHPNAELTIRFVEKDEIYDLNQRFRSRSAPTNVLSFPFQAPDGIPCYLLGDIVICPKIIEDEAIAQQKPLAAHYAHMVIHGTLHLLGFDHIVPEDADVMEQLEIKLLTELGFANPYESDNDE